MENLKDLDRKKLSEIIKSLNEKTFQSEAQFQFDLAWKLHEKYKKCNVYLEDLCVVRKNEKNKIKQKYYTDIIVEQIMEQSYYRVAIELKYKTAELGIEREGKEIYLFDHGAVDLGRFDYLWDVHRIELLTGKSAKECVKEGNHLEVKKKCNKGFAVLLTNEKKYWEKWNQKRNDILKPIDWELRFDEEQKKLYNNHKGADGKIQLDWQKDKTRFKKNKNNNYYPSAVLSNGKPTFRAQPICLKEAYSYIWEDYSDLSYINSKNGRFRYVIIEVK